MKKLISMLIDILTEYINLICVVQNNVSYTYSDIKIRAQVLAYNLNRSYDRRITITLIANNSVNWIIVFLGVLFSKHRLVIFPSKLGIIKTSNVVTNSRSVLLFTDLNKEALQQYLEGFCEIVNIKEKEFEISHFDNSSFEYSHSDYIITYSPRRLEEYNISEKSILSKLNQLDNYRVFEENDTYIAYADFASNYIIGLLLPLIHGCTIIIPKDEDSWAMSNTLQSSKSEVVILNSRQFEDLYNEVIEDKLNTLNDILIRFNLKWLRELVLKRRFKRYFPNLRELIILNSTLNPKIETTLKSLKIPYIVTYGRTMGHSIETFDRPENFVPGSVGEILNPETINSILEDDSLVQSLVKDKVIYRFLYSNKNRIQTEQGFILSESIELTLKNISPVIRECIVVFIEDKLTLIVVPDLRYANFYGYDFSYISEYIWSEVRRINRHIHTFEKIEDLIILPGDFTCDTFGRVIKDYYNEL